MSFTVRLLAFYFLCVVGLFVYLKGFFPVKISNPGYSAAEDVPPAPIDSNVLLKLSGEEFLGGGDKPWVSSGAIPKNFTKLVLVVIDAFREDFVYGSGHLQSMPFLHQRILLGDAAGFVSRAQAPTLTMPRVKAMMTGSVPGYFEMFLSLDQAKELTDDSLIRSASADGRSIVFYGDETWTKLFPTIFKRKNGIPLLSIADHTTADENITWHASNELLHPHNFDIMILHYMGLDHIGLTSGSRGPLVDGKLKEMDSVLQTIYESLEMHDQSKPAKSLLVVTGDHGMTDKGSHGGTTMPERNVPLVFLRPGLNKVASVSTVPDEVDQTDIAVTLSLLLGLPIPRSSVGKPIVPLIKKLGQADQLHAMQYNCHHLLNLAASTGTAIDAGPYELINPLALYRDALLSHATWLKHVNAAEKEFEAATKNYLLCQQTMSERMTSNVARYNYSYMGIGMVTIWLAYLAVVLTWAQVVFARSPPAGTGASAPSSPFTWGMLATAGTLLHGVSIISTSFLEEEHQTWYFLTVTFLTILFASIVNDMASTKLGMAASIRKGFFSKSRSPSPKRRGSAKDGTDLQRRKISEEEIDASWDFVELESEDDVAVEDRKARKYTRDCEIRTSRMLVSCLLAHRMLRSLNQTGIQSANVSDVGDWLNDPDHMLVLSIAFVAGLLCLAVMLELLTYGSDPWRRYPTWVGLAMVYVYRAAAGQVMGFGAKGDVEEQSMGLIPAWLTYAVICILGGRLALAKLKFFVKTSDARTADYALCAVMLLASLLLRLHNVWALVFNLYLYWSIFRQLWPIMNEDGGKVESSNFQTGKIVLRTTLCYWFGQMAYFSMGNSNSLATIDVSAGYVGIPAHTSSMEDTIVMLLIAFATYVGPLTWTMLCLADCVSVTRKGSGESKSESRRALSAVFSTIAFLRLTPAAFYIILVTAMRYHLFIWSVFAPKLLFETASTIVYGMMLLKASIAAKWLR